MAMNSYFNPDEYPEFCNISLAHPAKIPQIPHLKSIHYITQKLTNQLPPVIHYPVQRPPVRHVRVPHPLSTLDEELLITEALYLGTKDSLSYLSGRKRGTFDLRDQLYHGVRFFDFEVTTREKELWFMCDGRPVEEGAKIFEILVEFATTLFDKHKYPIYEKILLNFREFDCPEKHILPTLELLSDLIIEQFLQAPRCLAAHMGIDGSEILEKMRGVFIIFGPKDLDFALGENAHYYNWGTETLFKIEPEFNGENESVMAWGSIEKYNFDRYIDTRKLVWLNIYDPKFVGRPGHEFHSLDDIGFIYPKGIVRFNIISFGSLTSENVDRFFVRYKPPK